MTAPPATEYSTKQIRQQLCCHTLSATSKNIWKTEINTYTITSTSHHNTPGHNNFTACRRYINNTHLLYLNLHPCSHQQHFFGSCSITTCTLIPYLHNSTALLLTLQDLSIPDDALLVAIDVTNLYPSIPQTKCLSIIYDQLHNCRHLLTFDPNLTIQLLHTNINHFTSDKFIFQQIHSRAMGAPFLPTTANIFMSTILTNFQQTSVLPRGLWHQAPLRLTRE